MSHAPAAEDHPHAATPAVDSPATGTLQQPRSAHGGDHGGAAMPAQVTKQLLLNGDSSLEGSPICATNPPDISVDGPAQQAFGRPPRAGARAAGRAPSGAASPPSAPVTAAAPTAGSPSFRSRHLLGASGVGAMSASGMTEFTVAGAGSPSMSEFTVGDGSPSQSFALSPR